MKIYDHRAKRILYFQFFECLRMASSKEHDLGRTVFPKVCRYIYTYIATEQEVLTHISIYTHECSWLYLFVACIIGQKVGLGNQLTERGACALLKAEYIWNAHCTPTRRILEKVLETQILINLQKFFFT